MVVYSLKILARLAWFFMLTMLAVGLLAIGPTQADSPPLPLADYWRQLQEIQMLVTTLQDAASQGDVSQGDGPESVRARLVSQAERLAAIKTLRLADGQTMPIDHSFLIAQLRADPPDLARLDSLLTTLLAGREAGQAVSRTGSEPAKLAAILERAEFQWAPEDTTPSWSERFWQRFWEWVGRWFPDISPVFEPGSSLNYLLTGLGTLILILVLFYILRSLTIDFVSETALALDAEETGQPLTADTALQRAQNLSKTGDYRTAVRYLYLSALLSLEEHGLLRYNRSLTNREYLRSVAHLPELAAILRDVVDVFDRVWYGYQPLDQGAYAQYATRVAELRQSRPAPRQAIGGQKEPGRTR